MIFLTIRPRRTKKEIIFGADKYRKKWTHMVSGKIKCYDFI